MMGLEKFLHGSALPPTILELVKIRASQINGCGYCLHMHTSDAKKAGETDERLFAIGAWRESPLFTDEERAALALTESATRIADSAGVPDDVWDEAADNFDEATLGALIMAISTINAWNRMNVTIRNPAAV
ncbi:MAG TPA: carboxymuconolactone decarboxylase family protein [Mycobacteriales bacterium]|nr:carboxymuconolactone decarboxylase family protein [Mycobacteriales bacterium]